MAQQVRAEFRFDFPEDAMSNVENWVEQEMLSEEQEVMRLLISNKVMRARWRTSEGTRALIVGKHAVIEGRPSTDAPTEERRS